MATRPLITNSEVVLDLAVRLSSDRLAGRRRTGVSVHAVLSFGLGIATLFGGHPTLSGEAVESAGKQRPDQLNPQQSLVDYLKTKGRPSSLEDRRALFEKQFPKDKGKYTGTAEQNLRLLEALLSQDEEAKNAAAECEKRLKASGEAPAESAKGEKAVRMVEKRSAFLRWIPAPNFGVNGTFAVSVWARVYRSEIVDKDFGVAVDTAAGTLGRLEFSGTVSIFEDGKSDATQEIPLVGRWWPEIEPSPRPRSSRTTARMYAKQGTVIRVPPGKKIVAKVTVNPIVVTRDGTVPLWTGTLEVPLSK